MICVIYLLTAIHPSGMAFWNTPLAQLVPGDSALPAAAWLDNILGLKGTYSMAGLPLNVIFMMVGAFGTVGNIINR